MTTRRILTIIIVLLVLAGLLLGVSWYAARRTAEKNGTTPLTFRQFLGIGTPATPGTPTDGELSGEFTGDGQGGGTDTDGTGVDGGFGSEGTVSDPSIFTSGPIMPEGGSLGNGGGLNNNGNTNQNGNPSGSPTTSTTTTTTTTGQTGQGTNPTGGSTQTVLSCSDADTTIAFTAAEIARLNTLQLRFSNIAANLYTDADVAQQVVLYDTFKNGRSGQINELITFCEQKAPLITDATMQRRVPTPLYNRQGQQEVNTFTDNPTCTSDYNSSCPKPIIDNTISAATLIERLLRINMW